MRNQCDWSKFTPIFMTDTKEQNKTILQMIIHNLTQRR
jgi:hypothetical protein